MRSCNCHVTHCRLPPPANAIATGQAEMITLSNSKEDASKIIRCLGWLRCAWSVTLQIPECVMWCFLSTKSSMMHCCAICFQCVWMARCSINLWPMARFANVIVYKAVILFPSFFGVFAHCCCSGTYQSRVVQNNPLVVVLAPLAPT